MPSILLPLVKIWGTGYLVFVEGLLVEVPNRICLVVTRSDGCGFYNGPTLRSISRPGGSPRNVLFDLKEIGGFTETKVEEE